MFFSPFSLQTEIQVLPTLQRVRQESCSDLKSSGTPSPIPPSSYEQEDEQVIIGIQLGLQSKNVL